MFPWSLWIQFTIVTCQSRPFHWKGPSLQESPQSPLHTLVELDALAPRPGLYDSPHPILARSEPDPDSLIQRPLRVPSHLSGIPVEAKVQSFSDMIKTSSSDLESQRLREISHKYSGPAAVIAMHIHDPGNAALTRVLLDPTHQDSPTAFLTTSEHLTSTLSLPTFPPFLHDHKQQTRQHLQSGGGGGAGAEENKQKDKELSSHWEAAIPKSTRFIVQAQRELSNRSENSNNNNNHHSRREALVNHKYRDYSMLEESQSLISSSHSHSHSQQQWRRRRRAIDRHRGGESIAEGDYREGTAVPTQEQHQQHEPTQPGETATAWISTEEHTRSQSSKLRPNSKSRSRLRRVKKGRRPDGAARLDVDADADAGVGVQRESGAITARSKLLGMPLIEIYNHVQKVIKQEETMEEQSQRNNQAGEGEGEGTGQGGAYNVLSETNGAISTTDASTHSSSPAQIGDQIKLQTQTQTQTQTQPQTQPQSQNQIPSPQLTQQSTATSSTSTPTSGDGSSPLSLLQLPSQSIELPLQVMPASPFDEGLPSPSSSSSSSSPSSLSSSLTHPFGEPPNVLLEMQAHQHQVKNHNEGDGNSVAWGKDNNNFPSSRPDPPPLLAPPPTDPSLFASLPTRRNPDWTF